MNKNNLYMKIKLGLVVLLVIYLAAVLGRCSRPLDFDALSETLAADPTVSALTPQSARKFQSVFEVDGQAYDQVLYYAADSMMDVSELLIVHSSEEDSLEALQEAAQAHLDGRLEAFHNYGTNQSDLLEHAILLQRGEYLFFGVSEYAEQWEQEFLSAMKG